MLLDFRFRQGSIIDRHQIKLAQPWSFEGCFIANLEWEMGIPIAKRRPWQLQHRKEQRKCAMDDSGTHQQANTSAIPVCLSNHASQILSIYQCAATCSQGVRDHIKDGGSPHRKRNLNEFNQAAEEPATHQDR